ncbi:uncharacterized protein LOC120083616 isoform X2 [Benincasa hispida]|uniref:uncharacterized protein LOC120083616 isoform X2 n=1 Tax=Benincasa hispida TaxID=102211 RepID=UPI001901E479|nr:uncharacterized protein LOC120083616 isoform X2 [Benincasa hispida]
MPSGVKKRKAARKKMEKEAKISSSNEEFKSQNGSNSESRELNAIYNQHNCHDPLDGDNERLENNDSDASPVLSTVDEEKSLGTGRIQGANETIHEFGFDGNGVVEVEKELTSTENNACQSISIEFIKSGKKYDEREDENSSSSSAKECSITDKKAKAYLSSNVFNDKPNESSPATIGINESASVGECTNSSVETTQVPNSVNYEVPLSIEKFCLMKVAAGENLVASDTDANTLMSNQCDGTRASSFTNFDSLPKVNGGKVLAVAMENDQMSSSMKEQGFKYLEGKKLLSSVSPAVGATGNKDDAISKDSEIPICSKKQISASAPLMSQRTSIFSCCGLFDLLKGSD